METDWIKLRYKVDSFVESEVDLCAPIDLHSIATKMGIVSIEPRQMKFDGYLARAHTGEGYVVRYKATSPPVRLRFTIAHEIGHLIYAYMLGQKLSDPVNRDADRCNEEERIVNKIAARILIPEASLVKSLARLAVKTVDACVRALGPEFRVSKQTIAGRLLESPSFVVVAFEVAKCPHTDSIKNLKVRTSEGKRVFFSSPPSKIAAELVSRRCQPQVVTCEADGAKYRLYLRHSRLFSQNECMSFWGWVHVSDQLV